jgi:hypothetical protein
MLPLFIDRERVGAVNVVLPCIGEHNIMLSRSLPMPAITHFVF